MKPASMWKVQNYTPFAASRSWSRDKDGVHEWIVVVKGTYDIAPHGALARAEKQVEPLLLAEYNGEDGASSLRYDADMVADKPTTDILVNGTAYAPGGRPSTGFDVSLRVGSVSKTLRVHGNRRWERGPMGHVASSIEPIVQVPIVYERAFGGTEYEEPDHTRRKMNLHNPVGCGLIPRDGELLPNFEYPSKGFPGPLPAGFGAIASHWQPRIGLHGTFDATWTNGRYPLLPCDWDPRSLLCSPEDQRPSAPLRGGEPVQLLNMTPSGRLLFTLPKVEFEFRTRIRGRVERHRSRVASVIIEPDVPRLIMVWQSSLRVPTDADYLERTIIREAL